MGEPVIIDFPPKWPKIPGKAVFWILGGIFLLIFFATSYYQVEPNETAVILRFGKLHGTASYGPHFKLPFGIDRVFKVKTDFQYKMEFGFRTLEAGQHTRYSPEEFDQESLMLTGDLNIADVEWVVQYQISEPMKYLFQLRNVEDTIRDVTETAMRAAVGDLAFDKVIKSSRETIETEVLQNLQAILNAYDVGVQVKLVQLQDVHPPDPVKDSFDEVNRAKQEMEQMLNEAQREYNKVIYKVEGEAKQMISEAEGYAVARINRAEGEAKRFEDLMKEYQRAREVTRQRLYLEALQEVMTKVGKVYVIDADQKSLIPYLPLDREVKP
ncbi:MAG TPA: FtsH protease activity modulator HflK [Thermoanaerobaculia bacterium]|nr:FtsH protease activity modulator HflK [Thermoanaerobaculia bacterium]HUM30240.1 FtsH protease activity modulator HflK [Thermoanaerobaculia bacterium]HXK68464.1 FtsH protease activity modulator HflK [Thermoanaerobaculia bacterium]